MYACSDCSTLDPIQHITVQLVPIAVNSQFLYIQPDMPFGSAFLGPFLGYQLGRTIKDAVHPFTKYQFTYVHRLGLKSESLN